MKLVINSYLRSVSKTITQKRYFYIVLLSLLGLLPLTWFKDDFIFRAEELSYINYSFLFDKYLYSWSTHTSNGLPSSYSNQIILFPIGLLYKLFDLLKISEQIMQKIILVLFFETALFSSYALFYKFIKNKKLSFYTAVLYTFNFYMLSVPFYTAKMIQTILLPILFLVTLNYLQTRKIKYIFINFIVIFLFQGLFSNLPNALTTMSVYLLAILYDLYLNKNLNKNYLKLLVIYFISVVPIILNIFLIFYYSVLNNNLYMQLRDSNAFVNTFLSTRLADIFSMFHGAWWEKQKIYNQWLDFFENPIIQISLLVLFAFIFIGLFTIPKTDLKLRLRKKYAFWLFIFCISLFFTKGINPPFGGIYKFMFYNVPGFFVFREPWAKFMPLLIFSASIIFSLSIATISMHKRIINFVAILLIINVFPFFSGKVFNYINSGYSNVSILIPDYWKDIHKWSALENNKNLNIFTLPVIYSTQEYYNWHGSERGNLIGSFPFTYLDSNSINRLDDPTGTHREFLKTYSPKILSLFNIDYVLDQTDVLQVGENINYTVDNLVKDGVIDRAPVLSFEKLNLYKVNQDFYLPRIYVAEYVYDYFGQNIAILPSILNISTKPLASSYIMTVDQSKDNFRIIDATIIIPEKVKPNIQIIQEWDKGWVWPVSINVPPSSWKYSLVKLKEYISEKTTFNDLAKIDLHLWLAAKRLSEIKKYELFRYQKTSLDDNYLGHLEYVFDSIKNYPYDKKDEKYWGMVRKISLYTQNFNKVLVSDDQNMGNKNRNMYKDFKIWLDSEIDPNCQEYCYEVIAKSNGHYDIFLKDSELQEIYQPHDVLDLSVIEEGNNESQVISQIPTSIYDFSEFSKIGSVDLIKGKKYILKFSIPSKSNLLSDDPWKSPDIDNNPDGIDFTPQSMIKGYTIDPSNDSQNQIKIWSNTIRVKEIEKWEPSRSYKISFKYRVKNGELGIGVVERIFDKPSIFNSDSKVLSKKLTSNSLLDTECQQENDVDCWNTYERTIHSNDAAVGASIYTYAIPDSDEFAEINLKDVKVVEHNVFDPILISENDEQKLRNNPVINFEMINPTKYLINVQNASEPYSLVFSQTFHDGWKIYLEGQSIAENTHSIANGFANSWEIHPKDVSNQNNYTLVLEYSPQRIFYITWGLSIIGFILSVLYIIYEKLFSRDLKIVLNEEPLLYGTGSRIKVKHKFFRFRLPEFFTSKRYLLFLLFLFMLFYQIFGLAETIEYVIIPTIFLGIILIKTLKISEKVLICLFFLNFVLIMISEFLGDSGIAEKFAIWSFVLLTVIAIKRVSNMFKMK